MSEEALLAHSALKPDRTPQSYREHVQGAVTGATANAEAVATHMADKQKAARFVSAIRDAATYHDLGKLDPDNQAGLRQGRAGRLPWDHVDAGVAHLLASGADLAAWMVRAHHAPGLPARPVEFNSLEPNARGLRGGRAPERDADRADALTERTDQTLAKLLDSHATAAYSHQPSRGAARHGLFMRLALSCLVDGDHSDAATFEYGRPVPASAAPRWEERLAKLDAHVRDLPKVGTRTADREAFYKACRHGAVDASIVACEGPVGIGKTTAVMAWALRRAMQSGARRIFVVAPYTTILSQTAKTLRAALLLPDEGGRSDEIVAEHHHRADFQALESRDLAVLWRAPIVVTTGVQLFETIAACEPARLRKLHGLPGSVVVLDEAHAALPAPLWRQNWAWIRELAQSWGCSFALASGSLARVWEEPDIVGERGTTRVPDIASPSLVGRLDEAEHARVSYRTLGRLSDPIRAILGACGPRLAVFNTVQTAALVANGLKLAGSDVLHLSTALCPTDRDRILLEVKRRLAPEQAYDHDWTLVATSLVEAGVELSFRSALRERFATASLIQIGGRTNRHGSGEAGHVYDFLLEGDAAMTTHPGAARSASVLGRFLEQGLFDGPFNASRLVTRALREEVRDGHGGTGAPLAAAEAARHYPEVAELGRLINTDTALVVVDESLKCLLARRATGAAHDLLAGSVQIWSNKIELLGLSLIPGRPGVYAWPHAYEPDFLGYMAGVLAIRSGKAFIISG